jgi:predicted Zn-dependent protease with MMP-like domain
MLGEAGFRITLRERVLENGKPRDATLAELRDTLVHEYAHCLAWSEDHLNFAHHDAVWGVRFSQAYQAVISD